MKKQTIGLKRLTLAIALITGSQAGYSLGLGKLNVESTLGEPLSAYVPFTSVTDKEKKKLSVDLASRRDFEAAGLDYPEYLSDLKINMVDADGADKVVITTHKPLREPVVHLLLKVDWAEGRLIREYTALLDPPVFNDKLEFSKPTSTITPPLARSADSTNQMQTLSADSVPKTSPENALNTASEVYGPVREGETLWSIAEDAYGVSDARLLQAMVGVLNKNPDSFIKRNVHGLLAGATLKMPKLAELDQLPMKKAFREFVAQTEQWKSFVKSSYGAPALAGTEISGAGASAESSGQAKLSRDSLENSTGESGGKLEIIVADDKAVSGEAVPEGSTQADVISTQLKKRVAVLEEALSSKDSESKELLERVQLLEDQLNKARKLIQIQNAELSRIQNQMTAAAQAGTDVVADAAQQAGMDDMAADQPAEEPTSAILQSTAPEAVQVAQSEAEQAQVEESVNPVTPVDTPVEQQVAQTPDQNQSMFEKKTDDTAAGLVAGAENISEQPVADIENPRADSERPRIVADSSSPDAGIGALDKAKEMMSSISSGGYFLPLLGGLALGGLGLLFVRRRRSVAEFEESILATSTFETESDFGASIDETKAETTFLNDFGTDADHADLEDVDPITEAEVYLAYGRVDQAAEILGDAIKKDPERQELKLKLLEVFSQKGDVKAFETLAEEMYSVSGNDVEIWDQVSKMGRDISPGNPLFAAAAVAAEATSDSAVASPAPIAEIDAETVAEDVPDAGESIFGSDVEQDSVEANDVTGMEKMAATPFAGMGFDGEEPASSPEETLNHVAESKSATNLGQGQANPLDIPSFGDSMDFTRAEDTVTSEPLGDIDSMDNMLSMQPDVDTPAAAAPEISTEPDQIIKSSEVKVSRRSKDILDFEDDIPVFSGLGDDTLSDDMLGETTPIGGDWDENTTKLDLAKAYIDMGDGDGARSILGEVLNQGSEEQKQQAAELMAQAS